MDRDNLKMIFSGNHFRKYQFLTKLFSPQEIQSKPQNILYLSLLRELELSEEDISYTSFVEGLKRIRKKLKAKENYVVEDLENPGSENGFRDQKTFPVNDFLDAYPPPSPSNSGRQEGSSIIKTIKDLP